MGIYPTTNRYVFEGGDVLVEVYDDFSGAKRIRVYRLETEVVHRTNCYCCSCGDIEGSDAACRNHGYIAERPCDIHDIPGKPYPHCDEDGCTEDGEMPEPVSVARAQRGEPL